MYAERDIVLVNPSVCPSVRHILILYLNESSNSFLPPNRCMTIVFVSKRKPLSGGAENTHDGEIVLFSAVIAVYLGQARSYYGTLIGSHT